ncbi:MAG TPA: DUF5996 family protein [Gammaproteobacteria bacterium]|nr:DUF5996 family protein [Gammaproteobacteria bacterium]
MERTVTLWPELNYARSRDTLATLQLWTQVVGKVRLALTPWLNHGWHVPLYVTARGLGTSPIPHRGAIFDIELDFVAHELAVRTSGGEQHRLALEPRTVADFYARVMAILAELGIAVAIKEMPNEVPDPIPFSSDRVHRSYDPREAHAFWLALIQADRAFKQFRTSFLGKASPVHFFWGSFDLAVTRFSGRKAPLHPGGAPGLPDGVTREAYSHEVSSAGFWPGNDAYPAAAFYSYAYPEPPGFRDRPAVKGAQFDAKLGEFILPYEAVRTAPDPDALLLDFLFDTYTAAADTAGWDRAQLECPAGAPSRVRPVP